MATIYVDASRPDDSGNGLTEGAAKRTPWEGQVAAASGDKILLKAGYCYDPAGLGSGLSQFFKIAFQSGLEIGTYGTASDKPILDALTYQNPGVGGWSYVSDGIWKKTFASFYVRRLWTGCRNNGILVSQRTVGTAMRRATNGLPDTDLQTMKKAAANPSESTILAALGTNDIWFGGGPATGYALYIYTGSATIDPPTYYDGIAFIQSDGATVGSVEGIYVENQTGIYAHDLHIRGVGTHGIRLYAQNSNVRDVADCLFEDIDVTHINEGAFSSRIKAEASPARRIRSSTFRRIYADYSTAISEMEPDLSYNYLSGYGDALDIGEGSVGVTIEGCTSINAMHAGLATYSKFTRAAPPVGCRAINNTIRFDSWHTYGRGLAALDGDTLIQGNLFDGQTTRSQLGGSVQVIGNVWTNLRLSGRDPTRSQCLACESYMFDGGFSIGSDRYLRVHPINVRILHNTFYSPVDYAIGCHYYTTTVGEADNAYPAGAVTVKNNIVHQPANKFISTYEDTGKVINQQIIENNCVYNTATGDNKIGWRGSNYAINVAPGCSGNLEVDPLLNSMHLPGTESVQTGGTYLGGSDFYGRDFPDPAPIGAAAPFPGSRPTEARRIADRRAISTG